MPEEVLLLPVLLEIRTDTRPEQNCKVRITMHLNGGGRRPDIRFEAHVMPYSILKIQNILFYFFQNFLSLAYIFP